MAVTNKRSLLPPLKWDRTLSIGCLVYLLVIGQYEVITECTMWTDSKLTIRIIPSSLNHKTTPPNIAIQSWNLHSSEAHLYHRLMK